MSVVYCNQAAVNAACTEVESLGLGLRVEAVESFDGVTATAVIVRVSERGNKHVLDKLKSIGFEKYSRRKSNMDRQCFGYMYDGYGFDVMLRKRI